MRRYGTDLLSRHAGTGVGQRVLQRAVDEIMDQPRITEAHLVLGRMHVDVDAGRVQFQEQHVGRLATVVQHVAIGHLHRMGDATIAHRTAVDIQVLLVGTGTRIMRLCNPPMQAQAGTAVVHAHGLRREALPLCDTRSSTSGRASASERSHSSIWPSSVRSARRNLRRAGTL
ncbi:hypothetical protein G6F22_016406 [Rhizopus arrhizus]|nr:hypothetical protein G6F22_016406 [Rhizopus arrhizus]